MGLCRPMPQPPPTAIKLTFGARRQNTNLGDDQFRIWLTPTAAYTLAQHIPELLRCLATSTEWKRTVDVRWQNGRSRPMVLAAYSGQGGEISFTASNQTRLFGYARNAWKQGLTFSGTYLLTSDGRQDAIVLDLRL